MKGKIMRGFDENAIKSLGLDVCAGCGSNDVVVIINVPDKVKGLPIEKLYPLCKKCADEFKIDIPDSPALKINKRRGVT